MHVHTASVWTGCDSRRDFCINAFRCNYLIAATSWLAPLCLCSWIFIVSNRPPSLCECRQSTGVQESRFFPIIFHPSATDLLLRSTQAGFSPWGSRLTRIQWFLLSRLVLCRVDQEFSWNQRFVRKSAKTVINQILNSFYIDNNDSSTWCHDVQTNTNYYQSRRNTMQPIQDERCAQSAQHRGDYCVSAYCARGPACWDNLPCSCLILSLSVPSQPLCLLLNGCTQRCMWTRSCSQLRRGKQR